MTSQEYLKRLREQQASIVQREDGERERLARLLERRVALRRQRRDKRRVTLFSLAALCVGVVLGPVVVYVADSAFGLLTDRTRRMAQDSFQDQAQSPPSPEEVPSASPGTGSPMTAAVASPGVPPEADLVKPRRPSPSGTERPDKLTRAPQPDGTEREFEGLRASRRQRVPTERAVVPPAPTPLPPRPEPSLARPESPGELPESPQSADRSSPPMHSMPSVPVADSRNVAPAPKSEEPPPQPPEDVQSDSRDAPSREAVSRPSSVAWEAPSFYGDDAAATEPERPAAPVIVVAPPPPAVPTAVERARKVLGYIPEVRLAMGVARWIKERKAANNGSPRQP